MFSGIFYPTDYSPFYFDGYVRGSGGGALVPRPPLRPPWPLILDEQGQEACWERCRVLISSNTFSLLDPGHRGSINTMGSSVWDVPVVHMGPSGARDTEGMGGVASPSPQGLPIDRRELVHLAQVKPLAHPCGYQAGH